MVTSRFEVLAGNDDVFALRGELDMASYEIASDALAAAEPPITLDLSELTFMDSHGVHLVADLLQRGPVTIKGATAMIQRTLEITGMTSSEGLTLL